jgi:MoxR-like ATPase
MVNNLLRQYAEETFKSELDALIRSDRNEKPTNWLLSPTAVRTYILGGTLPDGSEIEPKYFGSKRLVEIAIASLATDRGLLLAGIPGTAKTWVSEHLCAAISGNSKLIVQGSSGTGEEHFKYGWNYARLLQEGPSEKALVPSPVMIAMRGGSIVRIEELTRVSSDIQDALIGIMSEKSMVIPELDTIVRAVKGFNIIATANQKDKGINELSSALQRRFNIIHMPPPPTLEEEVRIVEHRVNALNKDLKLPSKRIIHSNITRLVTIFRELRQGKTQDGTIKLKEPTATLSTAEAISTINNSLALRAYFSQKDTDQGHLASSLLSAIMKNTQIDLPVFEEYLETVLKDRTDWQGLYNSCKELLLSWGK